MKTQADAMIPHVFPKWLNLEKKNYSKPFFYKKKNMVVLRLCTYIHIILI